MQDTLQGSRDYHVKFDFDQELVKRIAQNCESTALKGAPGYLGFIRYHSGDKFWGFSVNETGFLYGTFAKTHFRLMEIAVEKKNQKKGYGSLMLSMLFEECLKRGVYEITLRTSSKEDAHLWYRKLGAEYIGMKDEDYEMRFRI